jgi:undecaprenyl-phosphate 4-deoxy-4-formamido-L-arabinose transferase
MDEIADSALGNGKTTQEPVADISVVVPVYNSEKTVGRLVTELQKELEGRYSYNIVLVNDGSKDSSPQICRQLAERDRHVRFISFYKNFGQLSATLAGLREADGDIIVVMDDDLQNPPAEIHKLIDGIRRGHDFVFGASTSRPQQSRWRNVASYLNAKMNEVVFQKPKGLRVSSYYAIRQGVAREVTKYDGPFPYISGFIFRTTRNGCNVPVQHNARQHGRSGYGLFKLLCLSLNGLTNFSILPLRLSTWVGFASSAAGILFSLYLVARRLMLPEEITPGWTSVVGIVLIFSGLQLLAIGMLGEYLGRIFLFTNKTPQYAIREKYNCASRESEKRQ